MLKKEFIEKYRQSVIDKGLNDKYYFYATLPSQNVYSKYGNNDAASIFVLTRDNNIKELSNISRVVNALSKDEVVTVDDYIIMYE